MANERRIHWEDNPITEFRDDIGEGKFTRCDARVSINLLWDCRAGIKRVYPPNKKQHWKGGTHTSAAGGIVFHRN